MITSTTTTAIATITSVPAVVGRVARPVVATPIRLVTLTTGRLYPPSKQRGPEPWPCKPCAIPCAMKVGVGSALEGHYWRQESNASQLVERLRSDNGYFVFMLVLWLGFPLQGMYNLVIYLRPRLLRWKDAHPELTWYGAYQQVLSGKLVPTSDRTAHLARMHVQQPLDGEPPVPLGPGRNDTQPPENNVPEDD
jgi:hypothetical protein